MEPIQFLNSQLDDFFVASAVCEIGESFVLVHPMRMETINREICEYSIKNVNVLIYTIA